MAGINAALHVQGAAPFHLDRTEAYLGILVDDLISKPTDEPYRMFTSRAEFRLHLRIDNADTRLTPHGRRLGLIDDPTWTAFEARQLRAQTLRSHLEQTRLDPHTLLPELIARLDGPAGNLAGQTLADFLKRPEVSILDLVNPQPHLLDPHHSGCPIHRALGDEWVHPDPQPSPLARATHRNELRAVETQIKYSGYLAQQTRSIAKMKRAESLRIPPWFTYRDLSGLSREMQGTFERVRPLTLGQASRLPGVTPAAISLLHVYIEIQTRNRSTAAA